MLPGRVGDGAGRLLTFPKRQSVTKKSIRGRVAQVAALVVAGCLLDLRFAFGCFALVQNIEIENQATQELSFLSGNAVGSSF